MRGAPFGLQGKGAVEVAAAAAAAAATTTTGVFWRSATTSCSSGSSGGIGKKGAVEPRSVLDHRSPSPPTSTSTLCSSQGGGSTDSAGVAAVSDNPLHKWPSSQDTPSSAPAEAAVGGGGGSGNGEGRREDWAAELQPIPAGLEIGLLGGDKCGLGMEDWESVMLEEPGATAAAASPGHDQSFLKWIMGEVEDPASAGGLRQHGHHHVLPHTAMEFEGSAGVLGDPPGLVDPVFGFEHLGGMGVGLSGSLVAPPLSSSSSSSSPVTSLGGFTVLNSNNGGTNIDGRILPISPGSGNLQGLKGPIFGNNSNPNPLFSPPAGNTLQFPLSLPPGILFQEPTVEEKPHLFGPNHLLSQQLVHPPPPNTAFFMPVPPYTHPEHQQPQLHPLLPLQPKRHHSMADPSCQAPPGAPFSDPGKDPFLRRLQQQQHPQGVESLHPLPYQNLQQVPMKPKVAGDEAAAATAAQQQQQQALVDQLVKAAELVEARNFVNARGILARLNHQLSPIGKPLVRSAYYSKEALHCIITDSSSGVLPSTSPPPRRNPLSAASSTPFDVVLKLSAYKAFSEVSPIPQFANFTCTQALLEELNGCDHIHIIDFDIGVGGQWSSFMQELAQRRCSPTAAATATPSLKITAFASLCSNHPLELGLTRENLSQFANDLNIPFEINILSLDGFEPASLLNVVQSDEAIAVNLPVGFTYPSIPALLRLVKQLAPKIVVSVDHGCDRSELSFSRCFFHSLQSATCLLDSIDAAGTSLDVANKIERYLLQPRIENALLGRYHAADKAVPWRALFNSCGFVSVPFSNFTEMQADCLLKRFQVRGFHVEKRQHSLLLCWQNGELVSVSAWRR